MPIIKATNLLALKKLLQKNDETSEQTVLSKLSPKGADTYNSVIATSWIPSDDEKEIMAEGAKHLFPDDPDRMILLGRALAESTMTGIYRIFIKIPTISFIIKRVASIWNTFYKKGKARVIDVQSNSLTMQVTELLDIEDYQTEITCGYIHELLELTGAKNVSVKFDGTDRNDLKWYVSWS